MALRQYRPDTHPYENSLPKEKQATYQTYQASNPHQERLKELLFFVNIVLFSIITVMAAYIYLSFQIPVFIAFLMAIVTGFIGLRLVQALMRRKYKQITQKKRRK